MKIGNIGSSLHFPFLASTEALQKNPQVLTEIRLWKQEADLSPCAGEGGEGMARYRLMDDDGIAWKLEGQVSRIPTMSLKKGE